MSKINRVRLMNLNYNSNTIRIDDETFDLGGESTLLSLRNGGGKTVLVQMISSLFVNKAYRDFGDRSFKSYFTTNRPTFILSEWRLDGGQGYFLAGMMVRKCPNVEENNEEELEMINFTGYYREACEYDLDNLPVIEESNGSRVLKGFGACKKEFERLKKHGNAEFSYYNMAQPYQRKMYFSKLREYQINHKEWETIIKKVNLKESGLSELFANAKDEKGLVEKWFLDAIENKLNQENNRIKEFQTLAYKFICQYRENQSKIKRKELIEQYFEASLEMQKQLAVYEEAGQELEQQKSRIGAFILRVNAMVEELAQGLEEKRQETARLEQILRMIEHERLSYRIYQLGDSREEYVGKRIDSEVRITKADYAKQEAEKELCLFQCAGLYEESLDFQTQITSLQERTRLLMEEQKDSEEERNLLGGMLYTFYQEQIQKTVEEQETVLDALREKEQLKAEKAKEKIREQKNHEELSRRIGALETAVASYDIQEGGFNERFGAKLSRNILGEYEEGTLEIQKRQFADELTAVGARVTRLTEELYTLKEEEKQLIESGEALKIREVQAKVQQEALEERLQRFEEELARRRTIMRYVSAPEQEEDRKVLLLERLERKQEELERTQDEYKGRLAALSREYENLKQGKVVELPEHITAALEEQSIDFVYGMEWLKRNGRELADNQKLVELNPFLPYCIILSRAGLEKLQGLEQEIYTSFPVPVIVKDELECACAQAGSPLIRFDRISFLVMFQKQLLNPVELEKLLNEKQSGIDSLREKVAIKAKEKKEYQAYYTEILNQTVTRELMEDVRVSLEKCREERKAFEQEDISIRKQKKENEQKQEEAVKSLEETKQRQFALETREREYQRLIQAYEQYLDDRQTRERALRRKKEAGERIQSLEETIRELEEQHFSLRQDKEAALRQQREYQRELSKYQGYQEMTKELPADFDSVKVQARYLAITEGIAAPLEELSKNLLLEEERYQKKREELVRRNQYGFSEEEYQKVHYSEERIEALEEKRRAADYEQNQAKEENNRLEKKITELETRIEEMKKRLKEQTGDTVLVERSCIVRTDFEERSKLTRYEREKSIAEVRMLEERMAAFLNTQSVMAEYTEYTVTCEVEPVPLESFSGEELKTYQGALRRDLNRLMKQYEVQRQEMERIIRSFAGRECYREDFFRKGFENLLALTGQVLLLRQQLETILASYRGILRKLQVDLENVDKERRNVEEIFLEYVKDIDDNMRQIDKNSTINIRGRSIKMLKLHVPEWEDNKELYVVRVRDYVEHFIERGLETIEENGNVEELLGKLITTKKLYDEVVGIGNIGIRLYKIEAEREVPISWQEVSSNSGGEGFLSAFVILTCLLSYMRRDETDLFATGEEGKVLIMDNPFAQTNAEHLLKPLMDMAKKTNTQLICLSGLGGDSIYNRFDNIYVLNVVNSNMRRGMQYLKSRHMKGEDIKKMVLSRFEVEQMNLFDMEEV